MINPVFFAAFFGTALLAIVLAGAAFFRLGEPGSLLVIAASVLYLATIVITMVFNVPLNDALAAAAPDSSEGAALWNRYGLPAR